MAERYNWFFTHNVPIEQRFAAFGTAHFIYMIFGVIAIVGLVFIVKRSNQYRGERIIKGIAIGLFIFYFLRAYMFYRYYANFNFLDLLPLHLCIISGFILPLTVFMKNKLMWNLSYAVLMPGAVIAIITPEDTLNYYHSFGWMPLVFFVWHFIVVAIPILKVASGEFRPDIREYPKVLMILCGYAIFIFILNKQLNTNYLYLNGAARGTLLEVFEKWLGNPGYIIPMALLVFFVSFMMYVPWRYVKNKSKV
ncbi:MAG: TIGR02206 family membrane protein [Lachnospiraceae bacterium]|nr:TIGR02206 family membrane protein [Lachnospiraceae bacterium]